MDQVVFWRLIDESRAVLRLSSVDGSLERQANSLRKALENLIPEEIIGFRDCFRDRLKEAYRWDLWAAAYLIGDGCSDDRFMDFRNWLISTGQETFERALRDPDSLSRFVGDKGIEDFFFEGFQGVPMAAYKNRVGRPMPAPSGTPPSSPTGQKWNDASELRQILPNTWASTARTR